MSRSLVLGLCVVLLGGCGGLGGQTTGGGGGGSGGSSEGTSDAATSEESRASASSISVGEPTTTSSNWQAPSAESVEAFHAREDYYSSHPSAEHFNATTESGKKKKRK